METNRSASALYLAGPAGQACRIVTADGVAFEVQYTNLPILVRRAVGVYSDRRPRRLVAFEAVTGEPLRFTVTDQREVFAAVVVSIARTRSFCLRCGERLLAGVCTR